MKGWFVASAAGHFLLTCLLLLWVSQAEARPESMTVERRRPIQALLEQMHAKYGLDVSYEDPIYLYSGDMVDVTAQARHPRTDSRVLMPAPGVVTLNFEVNEFGELSNPIDAVRDMLKRSNDSGERGRFELVPIGERWVVMCKLFRDGQGQLVPQRLPLDVPITLEMQDIDGATVLGEIRKRLEEKIGIPVHGGWYMPIPKVKIFSVRDMPARLAITRLLDDTHRQLIWYMLYDPTTRAYYLNTLHAAPLKLR